jgi:mannose-6-phosphate isomerase-like protein (cupin superfamily)
MHPLNVAIKGMKWQKLVPQLGDGSSEIAILRTQIMIRVPSNYHVPRHWYSANETQTILSGAFIIECDGQRAELGPGSSYYAPVHCHMRRGRNLVWGP